MCDTVLERYGSHFLFKPLEPSVNIQKFQQDLEYKKQVMKEVLLECISSKDDNARNETLLWDVCADLRADQIRVNLSNDKKSINSIYIDTIFKDNT